MGRKAPNSKKTVKTLTHDEASRKNIPTAEYQSVMAVPTTYSCAKKEEKLGDTLVVMWGLI